LNKEELPQEWKEAIIVAIYKKGGKLTVVIIKKYHYYQSHTIFYKIVFSQGSLHTQIKLLGIISMDFNVLDQLLIEYFCIH